jgi:hypothetical protein
MCRVQGHLHILSLGSEKRLFQTAHFGKKLFSAAGIPRDLRIVVQDHIQQGIVDLQLPVVIDESQFAELVHENIDPRTRGAHNFRERPLADFRYDWFRPSILAEICH